MSSWCPGWRACSRSRLTAGWRFRRRRPGGSPPTRRSTRSAPDSAVAAMPAKQSPALRRVSARVSRALADAPAIAVKRRGVASPAPLMVQPRDADDFRPDLPRRRPPRPCPFQRGQRPDPRGQQARAGRPQRCGQIDAARPDPRPPDARSRRRYSAARIPHRLSGAGSAERSGQCARYGAGRRQGARRAVARARYRSGGRAPLAAAHRRDRGAARRDRGARRARPRGTHPRRAWLRHGDAGNAALRDVGRLAHAGGAGRGAVRRAGPHAARRADQPPRPRSGAVARTLSAPLPAQFHSGQPRPPAAQRGDDGDAAPR